MSLKRTSLGVLASAANGITCSSSTNATPIVATINSGHGLKNDDRIVLSGITGNTNANGEWTLGSVAATTATLLGSAGNGTHAGTPVVAVLCDRTPLLPRHSAVAQIEGALTGTMLVEGSDDNSTFADVKKGVALAANPGAGTMFEVDLKKYMRSRCSAFTSGSCNVGILA